MRADSAGPSTVDPAGPAVQPIKVLLWSPSGSGEHYNGPASFSYRLYSTAAPGEVEVTLVHGVPDHERYALFKEQHFLGHPDASSLAHVRFVWEGCRWLRANHQRFDIIHVLGAFHAGVVPAQMAERLGLPSVLFVSNHQAQLGRAASWRHLFQFHRHRQSMVRNLSAVVAMSQDINDELLSYGVQESRIARIPMGVNTRVFYPAADAAEKSRQRAALGWPDRPTLLFCGTVVERKRPDLLVEALGAMKAQQRDVQLVIAGPESRPEYATQIRASAESLGVADRVIWAGFIADIAPLYRGADLFCLPSSNEGMSAALIESMASGVVPLVTPVSGSVDVVQHGENGQHVQANAESIGQAITLYLDEPHTLQAHAQTCVDRVQMHYSSEAVFSAYRDLFRRLKAGQPAAG